MSSMTQPARKSYFFGKGYTDVRNTIRGAWKRNFDSIRFYKDDIVEALHGGALYFVYKLFLNILAMFAVLVFGSIITAVVSLINIIVVAIMMFFVYIGFSVIWLVDRIYLTRNRIFTACHVCKERSLIPTYICPKCKAKHTNLTPGVYGILKRTCTGEDHNSFCGEKLPVTFFNGRKNLQSICPHCSTTLADRESVPVCIPVVGGRSVGKTAYITAFSKKFIDEVAPAKLWKTEFYDSGKERIYGEINRDYLNGSTRMTSASQNMNESSAVSFSFFVQGSEFKPERLVHIYDVAGEVFTANNEIETQSQYRYCHGIVLMIDPLSIPAVRYRCEASLTAEDIAGIGRTDSNVVFDSFLNKLREITGLSEKKMTSIPLAVVLSKSDSAGLGYEIGDKAIRRLMDEFPGKFKDYYDTQDYLCRKFLKDNGMESLLNNIEMNFSDNRFFSCTAIGHSRDKGRYNPHGVLPPMQWLFGKADIKFALEWADIEFTKKPSGL